MASKRFLLVALAFATVLLVVSEIASAKELASKSNHETGEVADAKYHHDDHGYYNGGRGGYSNGRRGGYNNGGGHGGYNNGGGYNHGGGRGGGYCRHGCCGRYYNGGCNCCQTLEEATAYKQAQETQTHN